MRVVTWNMGLNSGFRPRHDRAWHYLLDRLAPDIALVQEADVQDWVRETYSVAAIPPSSTGWGSAIVSRRELRPLCELDDGIVGRFGHRVAMATVSLGDNSRAFLASVHLPTGPVRPEWTIGIDHAVAARPSSPGKLFHNDIVYSGLKRYTVGATFIVGGDWMESLLWDRKNRRPISSEFFQRCRVDGWFDTSTSYYCDEVELQTWFKSRAGGQDGRPRANPPYGNDRIFVNSTLQAKLICCHVATDAVVLDKLSDHAPLFADFSMS